MSWLFWLTSNALPCIALDEHYTLSKLLCGYLIAFQRLNEVLLRMTSYCVGFLTTFRNCLWHSSFIGHQPCCVHLIHTSHTVLRIRRRGSDHTIKTTHSDHEKYSMNYGDETAQQLCIDHADKSQRNTVDIMMQWPTVDTQSTALVLEVEVQVVRCHSNRIPCWALKRLAEYVMHLLWNRRDSCCCVGTLK